jgi:hypothetical protein
LDQEGAGARRDVEHDRAHIRVGAKRHGRSARGQRLLWQNLPFEPALSLRLSFWAESADFDLWIDDIRFRE